MAGEGQAAIAALAGKLNNLSGVRPDDGQGTSYRIRQ